MKKIFLLFLFVTIGAKAQVVVNGENLNEKVTMFEVYLMAKPFSTKQSIFANSGSNNFKLHNYDTKKQSIYNADGKKFEKGEYLNLYNYLVEQGWEEATTRQVTLGNNEGSCIIFKRKKA
ncbi:hypothetical protein [Flavobacterium beibuense]|uniref:hypothetical protein n=1 Tax=Flavobacterium beibuense TaxID=657326 RepID=UPI003A9559E9